MPIVWKVPSNFGYLDPFHPHPKEADAIRQAVDQLIGGRTTFRTLAAEWNAMGLRRRRSPKPWDSGTVRQALTNDRFGGVRRLDGQIVDNPPEWFPLFSREKWDALQVVLGARQMRSRFSYNRLHLARGIAFCHWGAEMHHVGTGNRCRYVCSSRADKSVHHSQIADHILDNALRDRAVELMSEYGTNLLTYAPRPLDVLTKAIGALTATVERDHDSDEPETVERRRTTRRDLVLLEAERDDRLLYEALLPLSGNPRTMLTEFSALPLAARHTILRRTMLATVDLGRGTERILIQDLLS